MLTATAKHPQASSLTPACCVGSNSKAASLTPDCCVGSNGKAVHYNGTSLLQWRSVRLDVTLGVGDVAGIGWERSTEQTPGGGSIPKGTVFFTFRGQRLTATLDNVAGAMYPVVQIQKKVSCAGLSRERWVVLGQTDNRWVMLGHTKKGGFWVIQKMVGFRVTHAQNGFFVVQKKVGLGSYIKMAGVLGHTYKKGGYFIWIHIF